MKCLICPSERMAILVFIHDFNELGIGYFFVLAPLYSVGSEHFEHDSKLTFSGFEPEKAKNQPELVDVNGGRVIFIDMFEGFCER